MQWAVIFVTLGPCSLRSQAPIALHFPSIDLQVVQMTETDTFYDDLAPFYHLIHPDWGKSITRQGGQLEAVIREVCGDERTVANAASPTGEY